MGAGWNPYLRYPWTALLLTVLASLPWWWQWTNFQVTAETRILLQGDQRNLDSYEKVRQIMGSADVVVLSLECAEVFSPAGLDAVRRVSAAFLEQPGVLDVKSLTHSYIPVRRGWSFEMVPLVSEPLPAPAALAELRRAYLAHPLIKDVMVSGDARHTLITVTYREASRTASRQRALREQVDRVLRPFRQDGLRFQVLALPLIEDEIRTTLHNDLRWFLPLAVAVLALLLGWGMGSIRMLALVLLQVAVTMGLLPGLLATAGGSLNVFSVMMLPLLVGIQFTLWIHVATGLRHALAQGDAQPMAAMWRTVFKPSVFAVLTTAVGFFSLSWSAIEQIREFGRLAALGLGLVFFLTFGPGLAVVSILGQGAWLFPRPRAGAVEGRDGSAWLMQGLERWRAWLVGITGAALLITGLGLERIRTDIRAVEFLRPSSPARQAIEQVNAIYGGINVVSLEVDTGVTNGLNQPNFLNYLDEVHRYAASRPGVSGVYSYPQLLAMMNQIWEGNRPDAFHVPDDALKLSLFVVALRSQELPFLSTLCDAAFRAGYLVVRTPDMPAREYLAVVQDILDFAQSRRPAGVAVSALQGLHSILEADQRIVRSQVQSLGLSMAVIGVVLAFLWRSPRLAGLALVTNLFPIGLALALAGWVDRPLNSVTVMMAAIALGISVDDSVHLLTRWQDERRRGVDVAAALREALRLKGRAIVYTSLVMIALSLLFAGSSFPPLVTFGLLSAAAYLAALLAVLLFLPAALLLFRWLRPPDAP